MSKENYTEHFGVLCYDNKKKPMKISRETYIDQKFLESDNEMIKKIVKICFQNYDRNMLFFKKLDYTDFNYNLEKIINDYHFLQIKDLNKVSKKQGIYILVLDEYKQIYIGVSKNIKHRIQEHWSNRKSINRLIFGSPDSSRLSIDSFGYFDTTRIYVLLNDDYDWLFTIEQNFVDDFPNDYLLNRTAGGIRGDNFDEAVINMKRRRFND